MRFLADENFPLASVHHLRSHGLDVAAMAEDAAGSPDTEVLARATSKGRLLLTFDRDFGDLIFRQAWPPPPGLVYCRFAPMTPVEPGEVVLRLLAIQQFELEGQLTVVERTNIRQRPLRRG
jgi:predicted nuclease of predicted toxin-antitoxin system